MKTSKETKDEYLGKYKRESNSLFPFSEFFISI